MSEELKEMINTEFAECYTLESVAKLYFEIRTEIEKQLSDMSFQVAVEMKSNGVLDGEGGAE